MLRYVIVRHDWFCKHYVIGRHYWLGSLCVVAGMIGSITIVLM